MRLWTLHPKYLDRQGLIALWREALLAQAVLRGRTKGYTRHPQLDRFRSARSPIRSIATYLRAVHTEASRRGYRFDASKIARCAPAGKLTVTRGQLLYEWKHFRLKLRKRSPSWLAHLPASPRPHPLFRAVPGAVEGWEKVPTPTGRMPAQRPRKRRIA